MTMHTHWMSDGYVTSITKKNIMSKPILKWLGGKARVAPTLAEAFGAGPCSGIYREPFLGAGALFLHLATAGLIGEAALSDLGARLMATHRAVRDQPDKIALELATLPTEGDWKASYYRVRDWFNRSKPQGPRHAALFLWLNKACFNGLYRENKSGGFNAPVGAYKRVAVPTETELRACSVLLQAHARVLATTGFEEALSWAREGDWVYLDPPYLPTKNTSDFVSYTKGSSFGLAEHIRLVHAALAARDRGGTVVLTNSWSPITHALLRGFDIDYTELSTSRSISRDGAGRGKTRDTLVVLRP